MKQKNYFSIVRATLLVLLGMLLLPSSMKASTKTTTLDFNNAGLAAYFHAQKPDDGRYSIDVAMSNTYYSAIDNAKVGDIVNYKYSNTASIDISRLAFYYNSQTAGDALDGGAFYFVRDASSGVNQAGLFSGSWGNKLAVLNLIPSDKVTITYAGTSISGDNGNIHVENSSVAGWGTQVNKGQTDSKTVNIDFLGDLIISVNKGTIIKSIVIESSIAEYEIIEDEANKRSTFEFTAPGMMDENDVAVDFMKVTFGNINDLLIVNGSGGNLQSTMYNSETGSENLVTGGHNFQPTGGNFYAFKPTASGSITIEGGMHGDCIHLFIYDIAEDGWVTDGTHFYHDTYNQNESHWHSITFPVNKGRIYYICQDNTNQTEVNGNNAFHLHKFIYNRTFNIENLGVVVDNVDAITGDIALTQIENPGGTGGQSVTLKRCTGNISPSGLSAYIDRYGWLYMTKPTFADGTDHAGTVILDVVTDNGEGTVVVTFPYHANFGVDPTNPNRTLGHTWNFIDPRNSDSNFGNCWHKDGLSAYVNGETSGILSIGQYKNTGSTFRHETDNREWTWSRRVQGTNGTIHDPYYINVFDMVGDNADMIWETEGLIFNTETNLSIIYNESDAYDQSVTNPVDFKTGLNSDPDRYVGLLPDADGQSSFTIPSLKDGDRVLIFMKSGIKMSDDDADHGIFLNIHGAKDALGKPIVASDLYKAGGTNYIGGSSHTRYEGCYHFIKDGDGDMTFDMVGGSMCKLLYVRIYSGERISTNNILANQYVGGSLADSGHLLFMNDKGATSGDYATLSLRFSGKVQHHASQVLTFSGNLKPSSFTGDNFKQSGTYEQNFDFKSTVGEIGMFRLRIKDLEYNKQYVGDFCDRNFTVGYRDKVDSYPYTWDFTDIQGFSSNAMSAENSNYSATNGSVEKDPANAAGYEISLFGEDGYMKVNSGAYPEDCNIIFAPHKIGFGNQLWAGGSVIPETRGLWFYRDDSGESNSPLYNDCLQITQGGISFCNVPDAEGKRNPWWNYKMVVPDVENGAAVYLRMKRDPRVKETDKKYSDIDGKNVLFLNTRFAWGTDSKTSLTEDTQDVYLTQENGSNYSFYQVPETTDEYILAIKNTTGATNHLTYTLNGWIVKKLAVSKDWKTISKYGFATESRDHAIDHTLTGYMTGLPVEAYIVTDPIASTNTSAGEITVTKVDGVLPAGQGCFLANDMYAAYDATKDMGVNVLNNQTNLFVPDMHDTELVSTTGNCMVACISQEHIDASINGSINYILSAKYQSASDRTETHEGQVSFYRMHPSGVTMPVNSAYLAVPAASANGISAYYIRVEGAEDPLAEDFGNQDITAVKGIENAADIEGDWYNMNGQKLNGRPNTSGIYVVNGKKVVIK